MDQETVDILRESVEKRLRKESFEGAVGRTVRRRGMDFQRYICVMSELRTYAEGLKLSPEDAVGRLLGKEE